MPRIAIIARALAAGCSAATSEPRDVKVDQQVTLQPGQSANISGSSVKILLKQVNDSRCPSNVQCVTAGEALNIIQLSGSGADRVDTLRVNTEPKSTTYGGYRVEVVSVLPYPVTTVSNSTKSVTFLIR